MTQTDEWTAIHSIWLPPKRLMMALVMFEAVKPVCARLRDDFKFFLHAKAFHKRARGLRKRALQKFGNYVQGLMFTRARMRSHMLGTAC